MDSSREARRKGWRALGDEVALAATFLTRLPVPVTVRSPVTPEMLARSLRLYPLIGAGIGAGAAAVLGLALWAGLPPWPAATLALAALIMVTGALHEDGLADIADGFGGGRDRMAKLAIMRDSRVGTYGVLALVLIVLLRAGALAAIIGTAAGDVSTGAETGLAALVAGGALSRAGPPLIMRLLKPARADGAAASHGRPGHGTCLAAVGTAILIAGLALVPVLGLLAAAVVGLAAAFATAGLARLAQRQIGGYTGDVLGAAQQIAETAVLLAIAAAL